MKQQSPIRFERVLRFAAIAVCALACAVGGATPDAGSSSKIPEQVFREMAPAANQLDSLAQRFDADRDQSLSPQEQEAMIAFVGEKHGEQWAGRLKKFLHAIDANHDDRIDLAEWTPAVARVKQFAKTAAEPPKAQTVRIAMRDGVHLATDIYMPQGDGPFPVILSRTPYGRNKKGQSGSGFTQGGFVFVIQDMRGRFDSEGENLPFIGCGWGEHQDGVDTIEWLKKQPWCNGRIGTIGGSAGGITQNLLAGAAPDGLKAQHITVAAANLYSDASYTGGALRKADADGWMIGNKFDPRAVDLAHAHPSYDDYWRKFDTSLKFAQMNVPAVHIGGWFDMFAQATIDEFVGRQHFGANGSRGTQKLIMGPWTHGIGKMPVGELTFPKANRVPEQYNSGRWFDHYLHGADNGVEKEPAVAYYVMGDTSMPGAPGNEWRHADDWPVPAKETAAYFAHDGKLTLEKPAASGDAHVEFIFDPANPCPSIGGNNLNIARGPMNQNAIENRSDVVLFTSAPLDDPIEVTGRVKAKIFVSSSAADTDLSVRLCDVYPDGKSYLMAEGILRLRYRNSAEKPELLTPGRVEEVTVDCWSTSIIFNKGHRIRATVTSSNYPRFDINPGSGQPWSDSGAKVKQTNRIYCDAAHASRLLLPVVATTRK
ncbi:MAG: CocE/NonD family hydrolase [Verrucomicrobiia bacterium]